jgi:hypothetical protein
MWLQVVVFLEALAEEWLRCESVYMDVLPAIFKVHLLLTTSDWPRI